MYGRNDLAISAFCLTLLVPGQLLARDDMGGDYPWAWALSASVVRLSSDLDGVDRSVLDLLAYMCVQARIAGGEDLESGQDGIGRFQNSHNGHVARCSQRRPNIVGELLDAGGHGDDWNGRHCRK